MVGEEVVALGWLQCEVRRFYCVITHQGFLEQRRNGDDPLLMVFTADDYDVIVVNVIWLNATKFPTSYAGFEKGGEDGLVPD